MKGASCGAKNVGWGVRIVGVGVCRASNEVQSPLPVFHSFRKLLWMPLADNDN